MDIKDVIAIDHALAKRHKDILVENINEARMNNDIQKGEVIFLTPVPYYSTPQLREKGLVIVDLEQLQNAQKEINKIKKGIYD